MGLPKDHSPAPTGTTETPTKRSALLDRFCRSMEMNYERWHDGIGYELELLRSATPEEREQIEQLLLAGGIQDWRDVEALAALDTPRSRAALAAAGEHSDPAVRAAIEHYAPGVTSDRQREIGLVQALREARFYGGLTQTLDVVAEFHPPAVVAALLEGALRREGEVAVHFAAMLAFLHGQASEPFDMDQRPFFLRFNTENGQEREDVFRELCARIGMDATRWLAPESPSPD
ncbi:MAG: hypothetical protein IT472_04810 [Thermomonas sp.]|uniref:hypothetical protein n=1 Tax=Thermomonas sp. TaxID=1971895 RepID=UPI00260F9D0F|nr:hypothetical protein [Thermomonas sp.]MCC7096477.1 hypothetical protein [Thermomonas sp.]